MTDQTQDQTDDTGNGNPPPKKPPAREQAPAEPLDSTSESA